MQSSKQIIVCLFITLFGGILHTRACSCIESIKFTIDDYVGYDVVLKGRVISVTHIPYGIDTIELGDIELRVPFGGHYDIRVKPEKFYKGIPDSVFRFETPASTGINCTIDFKEGDEWYIFAHKSDSSYYVGGCGWSDKVKWKDKKVLKALKYVEKVATQSRKYVHESFWKRKTQEHRMYITGLIEDGKAQGRWEHAYRKGSPFMYGDYKDGSREGLWYFHFTERNWSQGPLMYKMIYDNDRRMAQVKYNREGKAVDGWVADGYEIPSAWFTEEEIRAMLHK